MTGAIGVSVGLGSLDVAVMLAAATMLTLAVMGWFKQAAGQDPGEE